MKVATVTGSSGVPAPFFMMPEQHQQVVDWIRTPSQSGRTSLVFAGAIKSGKSEALNVVLPGLITAQYLAGEIAERPVFVRYVIRELPVPYTYAGDVKHAITRAMEGIGVSYERNDEYFPKELFAMIDTFKRAAVALKGVNARLWLLLDDFDDPLLQPDTRMFRRFLLSFKQVSAQCGRCSARL